MQVVIYQGQLENESDSGASSPTTVPPDVENDDIGGGPNDESSSDEDNDGGVYDIEHDPGLRTPISQYDVNDQDSVRREYIALGPCQPKMKKGDFPQHECGGMRRFLPKWFFEFKWLEYSVHRDAAYCFVCYLFKDSTNNHGGDAFVNGGFRNWNIKSRFSKHAGAVNSAHCEAEEKYNLFMQPKTSILLPVATAGVERVFSSMNYIKNKLRSKMGQEYLNDCLVTFIERDLFLQVKDKDIINHFQNIKKRKVLL
ncbi:hypothetical protein OsJ_17716 [Oryza sativa Japonica Group]|uniref:TTF-type domain-containing protein n=1 Tax=Oryza sativa subsp. japonica TaxID=39947 RepID=B9FJE7_ORYSJ|nr:hypothetical protein OsJ_17716 [Oryza sativa Japonica Group]